MLALLETRIQSIPFMKRITGRRNPEKDLLFSESKILGMDVLHAVVLLPEKTSNRKREKRFSMLMDVLDRYEAGRICFRDGFYMPEILLDNGFREPDRQNLWLEKIPEIAYMSSKKHKTAVVSSKYAGAREENICRSLCGSYRYVALDSGRSGAYLCRRICEKTGMSIIERPSEKVLESADVAVVLDEPKNLNLGRECTVVSGGKLPKGVAGTAAYVSDCSFEYIGAQDFAVPEGYNGDAVLSEAVRKGKCKGSEIKVAGIKKHTDVNT